MLLRGLLDLKTPQEGGDGIPDPGTPPVNIYNQGFLPNLRSVLAPLPLRHRRVGMEVRSILGRDLKKEERLF
jgi:hypothetical protein